jgi:hypothetical protein
VQAFNRWLTIMVMGLRADICDQAACGGRCGFSLPHLLLLLLLPQPAVVMGRTKQEAIAVPATKRG